MDGLRMGSDSGRLHGRQRGLLLDCRQSAGDERSTGAPAILRGACVKRSTVSAFSWLCVSCGACCYWGAQFNRDVVNVQMMAAPRASLTDVGGVLAHGLPGVENAARVVDPQPRAGVCRNCTWPPDRSSVCAGRALGHPAVHHNRAVCLACLDAGPYLKAPPGGCRHSGRTE